MYLDVKYIMETEQAHVKFYMAVYFGQNYREKIERFPVKKLSCVS